MDELNSKIWRIEERISELEARTIEISQSEQQRENRLKKDRESLRGLRNYKKKI